MGRCRHGGQGSAGRSPQGWQARQARVVAFGGGRCLDATRRKGHCGPVATGPRVAGIVRCRRLRPRTAHVLGQGPDGSGGHCTPSGVRAARAQAAEAVLPGLAWPWSFKRRGRSRCRGSGRWAGLLPAVRRPRSYGVDTGDKSLSQNQWKALYSGSPVWHSCDQVTQRQPHSILFANGHGGQSFSKR